MRHNFNLRHVDSDAGYETARELLKICEVNMCEGKQGFIPIHNMYVAYVKIYANTEPAVITKEQLYDIICAKLMQDYSARELLCMYDMATDPVMQSIIKTMHLKDCYIDKIKALEIARSDIESYSAGEMPQGAETVLQQFERLSTVKDEPLPN